MMTMALAPESLSWCSSSRAVYSGLTFTTTKPARSTAATATGYWGTLGIMRATRSPLGQAQALQVGGELAAEMVGLGVADVLPHEAVGRAVGVVVKASLHQLHQRGVLAWINVGGHALRVGGKPWTVGHCHVSL